MAGKTNRNMHKRTPKPPEPVTKTNPGAEPASSDQRWCVSVGKYSHISQVLRLCVRVCVSLSQNCQLHLAQSGVMNSPRWLDGSELHYTQVTH